jgi:hypothetical protein
LLAKALTDPPLPELPLVAAELLLAHEAPPRLAAHLRLVHDVALQLSDWLATTYPALYFDREAALFGAATHDIGKILHPEELSGPGKLHEPAGQQLLLDAGVAPSLARFAATHGNWAAPGIELEDLLVSLADKVWKAKRVVDLEQLLVERLMALTGGESWEAFLALDDFLTRIADGADDRLAFQTAYPLTS